MNATELQVRIRNLNERARSLRASLDETVKMLNEAELDLQRMEYTCSCVRLNRVIGVYNLQSQITCDRKPLSVGNLVADTLTADRACPICSGNGVPK